MPAPQAPRELELRRTFTGAAFLSFQPLLLNALSVPVLAYIIRRLGAEAYGQWMIATALMAVFTILANLGLRGVFVRRVARQPQEAEAALGEQLGLRVALGIASSLAALLLAAALGYPGVVLGCVAISAIGLLAATVATTLSDLLQATHRLRSLAGVNLASGLALTVTSFLVALAGAGPLEMAAAYLVGPFVALLLAARLVAQQGIAIRPSFGFAAGKRLLAGSRHFAAQQVLSTCSSHAESLILPRLAGAIELGFFSAGSLMASRLTAFSDGLGTAAYPAMAAGFARSGASGSIVVRFAMAAAASGLGLAILAACIAHPLGELLFPGHSEPFTRIALITVWSLPLVGVELILGTALNAAGEDAAQARASLPAALVSVASAVALVAAFGATGAAWSFLLRPAYRCLFLAPLCLRRFGRANGSLAPGGCAP